MRHRFPTRPGRKKQLYLYHHHTSISGVVRLSLSFTTRSWICVLPSPHLPLTQNHHQNSVLPCGLSVDGAGIHARLFIYSTSLFKPCVKSSPAHGLPKL